MDEYPPIALLHLREAEIVRLCGLARAARGQEYARSGQVRQPERAAGTLRGTVLEGEQTCIAAARFSDGGLEGWECSCQPSPAAVPAPDLMPPAPGALQPCEHVAALLYLWVRAPDEFRAAETGNFSAGQQMQQVPDLPPAGATSPHAPPPLPDRFTQSAAVAPAAVLAPGGGAGSHHEGSGTEKRSGREADVATQMAQLEPGMRRFLHLVALADGRVTERAARRLFARFGLGNPEDAPHALERLCQHGLLRPATAPATLPEHAAAVAAERATGWLIPDDALAHLPYMLPLAPLIATVGEAESEAGEDTLPGSTRPDASAEALPPDAGLREQPASARLPALLLLIAAQAIDRAAPAPDEGKHSSSFQPTQAISAAPQRLQGHASGGGPGGVAARQRALPDLDAALARRWAEQLDSTPEAVRFGLGLLRLLGLLPEGRPALSPEQAREVLLGAWRMLLGRPPAEALRGLFLQWLHAHSARELVDLRDAGVRLAWLSQRDTRQAPDIAAENQAARRFVVDLLRRVPAGRWWSFRSLVEFVWRFRPDFLRGRQQMLLRPQWWLERLPDGQSLAVENRTEWRQGEGRYLALLLRRALHWLGAVDLALDAEGRLKGFRMTPLSAFLLGAAPAGDATQPIGAASPALEALAGALEPLENGQVLAPIASLDEETLTTLLWWCAPAGATAEGLRFRPDAERVAAALDAGQSLENWLAWLDERAPGGTLSQVMTQFRRWAESYGQVRLYESATLLEVADLALLPELEATLDLSARFVNHPLAPGLAVLRPDAAEALAEELRRRGYAPWITNHEIAD